MRLVAVGRYYFDLEQLVFAADDSVGIAPKQELCVRLYFLNKTQMLISPPEADAVRAILAREASIKQ